MFGAPPHILPGLTDPTGELSFLQRRAVKSQIARIQRLFPQIRVAVFVTGGLDPQTPLNTYTFWLFNNGNVCPNLEKGALSRTIFLVVDTTNARASLTLGYGLEPFVDESHLGAILESSRSAFAEKSTGGAIRAILVSLISVLRAVHRQIETAPTPAVPDTPVTRPREHASSSAAY